MGEPRHTLGPWDTCEIETRDNHGRYTSYGVCDASGSVIMDATNASIGCIEAEHDGEPAGAVTRWDSVAKANAHLIAAAPDLFEALTVAEAILSNAPEFSTTNGGRIPVTKVSEAREIARAALLKASHGGTKDAG